MKVKVNISFIIFSCVLLKGRTKDQGIDDFEREHDVSISTTG